MTLTTPILMVICHPNAGTWQVWHVFKLWLL